MNIYEQGPLKHLCQSHFMVLICTDVEGFYDLRAAVMHRSWLSCCFGPDMHQSASQSDQLDSPPKNVHIVQKVSFFTSGKQTYCHDQSWWEARKYVKAREIMALTLRLRASDQKPSFVFVVFQSGLKKA